MNLNCLTWIVSLDLAKQRRLRSDFVVSTSLVSSLSTWTVETMARGERQNIRHPSSSWDTTKILLELQPRLLE